jgi:hypothetical protein
MSRDESGTIVCGPCGEAEALFVFKGGRFLTAGHQRRRFFEFFRGRVDCISALQPPGDFAGRFNFDSMKLLLVCAHLEALAKARFPQEKSTARFQRLVEEQSGLEELYVLVALPEAQRRFELERDDARAKAQLGADAVPARAAEILHTLVVSRGHDKACADGRVEEGAVLDLPVDQVADALSTGGVDLTNKVVRKVLREERYSGIVWREVRCGLVHEARISRRGFDLGEDREPYYYGEIDAETGERTYPLVIPAKFLFRTLHNCVERFEKFCSDNDVDPYSRFELH